MDVKKLRRKTLAQDVLIENEVLME